MKSKNAVVGTKVIHKVEGEEGVIIALSGVEGIVFVKWARGIMCSCFVGALKKAEKVK